VNKMRVLGAHGLPADNVVKPTIARFFDPGSVAIVGASSTPGKPGHEVIRNILANDYSGRIYLVNPKGGTILGMPVYSSIGRLPDGVDLAVVVLPADASVQALEDCAAKGIQHVVLSAGGFAEVDEHGTRIQEELAQVIRKTGIRVLGPNTSGHISTPCGLTSSFFPLGRIRRGTVSYIAQTGNFATHTMRHILTSENFGVARVIGLGNKVDVDESDALEYLAGDTETASIVMYLESITNPRRFLEVAKQATRRKPVVLLKSGATEAGKSAADAHTAAMAAEDRLVSGLLHQAGIARISRYTQLTLVGKALSMLSLPKGDRLGFLAPSGAMLVTLADLCARLGLEVPDLEPATLQRLRGMSAPYIRLRNPIDIWAITSVHGVEFGYQEGVETLLKDPNIDAVVAIVMLVGDSCLPLANSLVDTAKNHPDKPLLIGFTGDRVPIEEFRLQVEHAGVPTFMEIEQPFEVLSILVQCQRAMTRCLGANKAAFADLPD